jgi:hypothetical protein
MTARETKTRSSFCANSLSVSGSLFLWLPLLLSVVIAGFGKKKSDHHVPLSPIIISLSTMQMRISRIFLDVLISPRAISLCVCALMLQSQLQELEIGVSDDE